MATVRPTFSESWYRVKDLRARLRPSAQVSRQFYRGERWYVVRDPAANQFHRLSAPAYRFVGLLDGTRTVAEAWENVGGQLADDAPTQNEVIQILSQLHAANLLESDVTPDAAVLLRRHKRRVKQQWQGRMMNILFPRIPLWDPDMFLKRWMPLMKPLLGPIGAVIWLAVVGTALFLVLPEWSRLAAGADSVTDPKNWLSLYLVFAGIKAIHELGHGFTCRRFGGEVHELGIMFLVLVPAPYVDASTAWAFPNKWHKIIVGAGGMIFELFVAAIMAFVWLNTSPTSFWNQIAYNAMLIASVSTIIFNINPLLRYDGYYMLSDLLEIPNLRYRAGEYSLGIIKRHLFKVKMTQPLPPLGQRFWLLMYWIFSGIYRTLVGVAIILMVWREVPVLGVLMAFGGLATWLVVPVVKVAKYLLIEAELHRKRARATAWVVGAAATAIVLVGFLPAPLGTHYDTTGIVEPPARMAVFGTTPGLAGKPATIDGQMVRKGDVILACTDRMLQSQIEQLLARRAGLQAQMAKALVVDQSERNMAKEQLQAVDKELAEARRKERELTIRAPMDGQLIAPQLRHVEGRFIKPGEELAMIAAPGAARVTVLINQEDAALPFVEAAKSIDIRLVGDFSRKNLTGKPDPERRPTPVTETPHPCLTFAGGGTVAPDPSDPDGKRLLQPHISMSLTLDGDNGDVMTGQRAYVRFELENKPLAWTWRRRLWQLIQANSKGKWM